MRDDSNLVADLRPPQGQSLGDRPEGGSQIRLRLTPSVTVIVPTYREVANIPELLRRIDALRKAHGFSLEVLLMDDDSQDGSVEAVTEFGEEWAKIVVRKTNRGLSAAVTDGLRLARNEVVVVMDADLSHPPEAIPQLLTALQDGADIAIGSRYVGGGSTDENWGVFRWINSRVATLLARPLTSAQDPMAGFFALRRCNYQGVQLNAVGYKIGLELIVKCHLKRIEEIPIHFSDRALGESKLSVKQQLLYIQHLRRLYMYKFAGFSELVQFAVVGVSGIVVNLGALKLAILAGATEPLAVAAGIGLSIVSNFALHRRFTFSYARHGNIWRQFLGFLSASSFGAAVNYLVTVWMRHAFSVLPIEAAASFGIAAGLGFNFLANRFLVFRKRRRVSEAHGAHGTSSESDDPKGGPGEGPRLEEPEAPAGEPTAIDVQAG